MLSYLIQISTTFSVLILNLIPFTTLMVLNFVIYRTIKRKACLSSPSASRTKREFYIARILILIVTLFGTCQILKCVINMLELVSVLGGK